MFFQTLLQEIWNSLLSFRLFGSILVYFGTCFRYTLGFHSFAKNSLVRYFKRIHSISEWNKWTKKWSKTFILYRFAAVKAKNFTETGYGSPENAEKNYFAQFILIQNHFVVLRFLWHEGTTGDFIQGNKYVNYSEWSFLSNLLYFYVNFPVLNKYKNIDLTLNKICILAAFGYVCGDFSLGDL